MGFVLISDVMHESRLRLSASLGEAGASEVSALLVDFGLKDPADVDESGDTL